MVDAVSGAGTNASVRNDPPPPPPPPPVDRTQLGNVGTASSAAQEQRTLAQTAAHGGPVEAGNALRTLDQQNGGDRAATDAQVRAETRSEIKVTDGTRTTSTSTTQTRSSMDGVEQKKNETKVETRTNGTSWSRTSSNTTTNTVKEFDERGNPSIDPEAHQQTQTVQSRTERKSETKVDGKSASHTETASGQRGNVGGSISNQTKVDRDGVGNQTTATGNVGSAKGTASGGFQVNENGASLNGKVGVSAGPLSADHGVKVEQGKDSTKLTNTTTVTLQGGDGKPVHGKVEYKQTDVRELKTNADGSTTYQVTGESKLTLDGGVDVKKVKVDASWTTGQRTVHTVTVPKGADVTRVDPNNPSAWAEGTRVMIKSEDYKGSTLGASYQNFGIEAGQEVRDGTAIVMEKKAGDIVAVSTGPTSGFTTSGALKVDIGAGVGFELNGENKTDFTFYKNFNVDLAAQGGQQAFNDVLTGRQAPTADANGVSDLKTVTTGDWAYKGGAKINTPFGDFGPEHQEGSHTTWTTYADGRVDYARTYDANGDGKPEVSSTATSLDGKTFSKPTYTFHIPITNDLERSNGTQFVNNPNLKVGDTVEVTLTADQLQDLRQKDMAFHTMGTETADTQARTINSFAEYIGRSGNGEAVMEKLFSLKNSADYGDYTSAPPPFDPAHALPGQVVVKS